MVAALLRAGAGLDSQDHAGWTPLHLAVWNEHFRVVEQLVQAGAHCSVRTREGNTPMHYTLMLVNPSLTKVLLKAGAEPAALNANGWAHPDPNPNQCPVPTSFLLPESPSNQRHGQSCPRSPRIPQPAALCLGLPHKACQQAPSTATTRADVSKRLSPSTSPSLSPSVSPSTSPSLSPSVSLPTRVAACWLSPEPLPPYTAGTRRATWRWRMASGRTRR